MKRLRNFESIAAFLGEREIDALQAAADARRATRLGRSRRGPATPAPDGASGPGTPKRGRRAGSSGGRGLQRGCQAATAGLLRAAGRGRGAGNARGPWHSKEAQDLRILANRQVRLLPEVEPRGFEPLTSAVQRRRDTLPGLSRVCKTAANKRISTLPPFLSFQEIYPGCCTLAAQVGNGHRLAPASVTSGNAQHGPC